MYKLRFNCCWSPWHSRLWFGGRRASMPARDTWARSIEIHGLEGILCDCRIDELIRERERERERAVRWMSLREEKERTRNRLF